jgi:hypothetical protein
MQNASARTLKAKSPGSSPGNATILFSITYMVFQEPNLAPIFRVRDAVGTLALKLGQFLGGLWLSGIRGTIRGT